MGESLLNSFRTEDEILPQDNGARSLACDGRSREQFTGAKKNNIRLKPTHV